MKPKIAIIGAGIAGLTLAHTLKKSADVTVFEKSRGVGGRMATRYADPFYFDHGTQYFTGRSRRFREFLAPYIEAGIVAPWEGKVVTLQTGKKETDRIWFEPHYVAMPGMNGLCKALADGISLVVGCEVAPLTQHTEAGWQLLDKNGQALGDFDWVVSTAPAAQTATLLGDTLPADHAIRRTELHGCYTVMLGFDAPWARSWIGAKCVESPLGWISVDSSKPGRNAAKTCLVLHSTNDWAEAHINEDIPLMQTLLLNEFQALTGIDPAAATYVTTHRWRYALVDNPSKSGFYYDREHNLASVGDWSVTSRIEEVWFAATELAETLQAIV